MTAHKTILRSLSSVGPAYIVSQGNITATIIWFAITTGVTPEVSYYEEKDGS